MPSAASLGREEWAGTLLKFTAVWMKDTKRVSVTKSTDIVTWPGEFLSFDLPNTTGESMPSGSAKVLIELCARVDGEPDEVLGSAYITPPERYARVHELELLGKVWKGNRGVAETEFKAIAKVRSSMLSPLRMLQ